jgi:nitroreductase
MQFPELVETRRSVRAYAKRAIEPAKLEAILTAIRLAPSAGNLQAYQVLMIEKEATKAALASAAFSQSFVAEAPVVLVFCANSERSAGKYGRRGADLYCIQDTTIAASYAQLAVTASGLASCWVGAFDEGRAAELLGLPARLRPIVILPIGYAAESPGRSPRRSLQELVHRDT